jgi:RHS repeat-associated protein
VDSDARNADHLSSAWTGTDLCAASPTPGSSASVGGPGSYWQSWTYDAAGDRLTQTDHDTGGRTVSDTTTTYAYPDGGSATDQPNTLTSTSATGPQAAQNTATYTYDTAGETTGITGGAGNQTLTWDDQDKLATDTTSAGTTSYVYDSTGNLVVRRDPGQTTLFVGDEQIVLNTSTASAMATRYYTIGTATVASRTGTANPVYLIPDRQGTDELAVDGVTESVTRRQFLPFGQARGTVPGVWPGGDKGYVGGTPDTTTGLENLGIREYDPTTGRFLSLDPLLAKNDPNQIGGYDYAGNDPVTGSDPTGKMLDGGGQCGIYVPCYGSGQTSLPTAQGADGPGSGGGHGSGGHDGGGGGHNGSDPRPPAEQHAFEAAKQADDLRREIQEDLAAAEAAETAEIEKELLNEVDELQQIYLGEARAARNEMVAYLQSVATSNSQLSRANVVTAAWDSKTGRIVVGWKVTGQLNKQDCA